MSNTNDRSILKKKLREMKYEVERERKALQKEQKTLEKQLRSKDGNRSRKN